MSHPAQVNKPPDNGPLRRRHSQSARPPFCAHPLCGPIRHSIAVVVTARLFHPSRLGPQHQGRQTHRKNASGPHYRAPPKPPAQPKARAALTARPSAKPRSKPCPIRPKTPPPPCRSATAPACARRPNHLQHSNPRLGPTPRHRQTPGPASSPPAGSMPRKRRRNRPPPREKHGARAAPLAPLIPKRANLRTDQDAPNLPTQPPRNHTAPAALPQLRHCKAPTPPPSIAKLHRQTPPLDNPAPTA